MKKILKGEFSVTNGVLSFTCTTKDVSFDEVQEGLIKLRDEIDRQIMQKQKCPYFKEKP